MAEDSPCEGCCPDRTRARPRPLPPIADDTVDAMPLPHLNLGAFSLDADPTQQPAAMHMMKAAMMHAGGAHAGAGSGGAPNANNKRPAMKTAKAVHKPTCQVSRARPAHCLCL